MRKYLLLFLLSIIVTNFSQTITFCEAVSEKGVAKNPSEAFNIPKQGGYFYFLVTLGFPIACEKASFDIYRLAEDYNPNEPSMEGDDETFETTIEMETVPEWQWFYKQVTFYKPGFYRIYVKDVFSSILTAGVVQIKMKK